MPDKTSENLPKSSINENTDRLHPTSSQRRKLKGVRGQLAKLGLAGLTLYGGISAIRDVANSNTNNDLGDTSPIILQTPNLVETPTSEPSPKPSPEATPQPIPESERAKLERQIEQKYGIDLLNMREGFERAGRKYDEDNEKAVGDAPPIRWGMNQLQTIDEFMSYLPQKYYAQIIDKPFALSLMDYGNEEEVNGNYRGDEIDMISFHQNAFREDGNREEQLSLFIHEMTHRYDIGVTHEELRKKVIKMLENQDFLNHPYFKEENRDPNIDQDFYGGIGTLGSFAPGQQAGEGTAGFAQIYVRGYERFMKAVGPILDSKDWPQDISRENLAKTFPRAQAIYDLYKNDVFEGREYDFLPWNKEINEKSNKFVQQNQDEQMTVVEQIKKIERDYGIAITYEGEALLRVEDAQSIENFISRFPNNFFPKKHGKSWKLIITEDAYQESEIKKIKDKNPDTLVVIRPFVVTDEVLIPAPISRFDSSFDVLSQIGLQIIDRQEFANNKEINELIIKILGGKEFLKKPDKLYPMVNYKINGHRSYFGGLFNSGDRKKIAEGIFLGYIYFGPEDFLSQLQDITEEREISDELFSKSKAGEIYNLIRNALRSVENNTESQ